MILYIRPLVRHQREVMRRKRHQLVRQYKVIAVCISWFDIRKKSWTRKNPERDTVQCHHIVHRFGLTSERKHEQEKPVMPSIKSHHGVHRFGLTSERKHEQERETRYSFNKKSSQSPSVWFDIRKKAWTRETSYAFFKKSSHSPSVWFDIRKKVMNKKEKPVMPSIQSHHIVRRLFWH